MIRSRSDGFTLIELLVTMMVFAVFGVMSYGGLSAVVRQYQIAESSTLRLRELQYAMRQLSQDLGQAHPRPVRDQIGDSRRPALHVGSRGDFPLELTRGGWSNLLGAPRSSLQRVAYYIEEDVLVRVQWLVVDRTLGSEPLRQELLSGVTAMNVRLLDPAREWQESWPPDSAPSPAGDRLLPLAVQVSLELEDYGIIERTLEFPQ